MDVGLLVLRVIVGLIFAGHGAQKVFGWFSGPGPEGTAGMMSSLGYRPVKPMAYLAGLTELLSGLLLAFGLLVPFAAAAIIGQMLNATGSVHWDKGLWVTNGGFEYPVVIATVAAAVAFSGPGEYSADYLLDLDLAGPAWGLFAIGIGVLSGLIVLSSRRAQPAAGQQADATEEKRAA